MIEFLCPNGHRIRCQVEQAGRPAKCPRCGVKFRVPSPDELGVSEAVGSDSGVSRPEFVDSGVGKSSPALGSGIKKSGQIEFLCPNGHKLHGPSSLQGKTGQCPECGTRFQIPTYEETPAAAPRDEITMDSLGLGLPDAGETAVEETPAVGGAKSSLSSKSQLKREEQPAPTTTISAKNHTGQSLGTLFAKLWKCKQKNVTYELKLRDGQSLMPDDFLKKTSEQTQQGVFVSKDADFTLTMFVIPWEAVDCVTIKGFKALPKEFSE